MTSKVDLDVLPLGMAEGLIRDDISIIYFNEVPPLATPSRKQDRYLQFFILGGDLKLKPDQQKQILEYISEIFYKTSGSVTAAMQRAHEELNKILLEINIRYARGDQHCFGWLASLVLHHGQIYLAQSGALSAYLLRHGNNRVLSDNGMLYQGLGQSQDFPVNYLQVELKPDDMLIVASTPSTSWDIEVLNTLDRSDLVRSPISASQILGPDINAIFVNVEAGDGKIRLTPHEINEREFTKIPASHIVAAGKIISSRDQDLYDAGQLKESDFINKDADQAEQPGYMSAVDQESSIEETVPEFQQPGTQPIDLIEAESENGTKKVKTGKTETQSIYTILSLKISAAGIYFKPLLRPVNAAWNWISPGEDFFHIPSTTMALVALLVPLVVVTAGSIAYFQLGREAQFDVLFNQAQGRTQQAESQPDIFLQHQEWEEVLELLNQVETISISPETQALRSRVNNSLDKLDVVKRIDYQPAIIGGLPESTKLTRIVAVENALYMLDAHSGNIFRAQLTSQGYRLDTSFMCGANTKGDIANTELIDIERWPNGYQPDAEIIGIDSSGTIQFCGPDRSPQVARLSPGALSPMNRLAGMNMSQGDLYVLDPQENAVWIYWNGDYINEPQLFFDVEIPPLADVEDLAVNNDELYLLHDDGTITLCVFSGLGVAPTRCTKPDYIDFRPGRESTKMVMENPFSQILFNPPPDPSLLLLNSAENAVYHFSLRNLAYQKKYLPLDSLPGGETMAFAIDPVKRNLFLAQGDNVYYGVMP